MPYKNLSDLPSGTKNFTKHQKEIFRAAFNSALDQYGDESKAFATAYSAVKKYKGESVDMEKPEVKSLKKFKMFVEDKALSGSQWEKAIEFSYNKITADDVIHNPKETDFFRVYMGVKDKADKIAEAFRRNKELSLGQKINSYVNMGSKKQKTTNFWQGKNLDTPKTDLLSGDLNKPGKTKISLKQAGGSQLMSAEKTEVINTFRAAEQHMHNSHAKGLAGIIKAVDEGFQSITTSMPLNALEKLYNPETGKLKTSGYVNVQADKSGKVRRFKLSKDILDQRQAIMDQRDVHHAISEKVKKFFETNQEFRNFFVYEAATGEIKFGAPSIATANFIVVFDPSGTKENPIKVQKLSDGPSKYTKEVENMAKHLKFDVNFKSTHTFDSSRYSNLRVSSTGKDSKVESWSLGSLPYLRLEENKLPTPDYTIYDMIDEEWYNFHGSGVLTESYLTEADFMDKMRSFLSGLFSKIKNTLVALLEHGLEYVRKFLGLEIEDITVQDNIVFSV